MQMQSLRLRAFAFVAGLAVLAVSGWVSADPPSRVARLGYMIGAVSFSPAGESDWVRATINRPLTTGDRLWADARARAELQVGGAMIRMSANTGVSILNLDDRMAQLQLTQGTLNVRVRRLEPGQVFEVDTPNLAFTLRQPGEYRIEVDPDGNATTIVVRKGQGEVYGEGAAYVVDARQPYRFTGTGLREYEYVEAPRLDEFDRWASDRDRRYDSSGSSRYVSQDVVGYQDLDDNGTWRVDETYGNVWVPNRVASGWAPYRDGHWAWVDPWGWTWVDDAPWGFAVSHYGRWANLRGTWGWVPGPVRSRAYYAPALVAFVGGSNFQLTISGASVGGVAWFPLGPREVYRPSYPVSRAYFENVNRSNTVVNTTTINNYYNNTSVTNVVYVNRQVPNAIVAVPVTAFVQSQPVSRVAVRVTQEMVASAPVAAVAPVAPTDRSVRGAAGAGDKPPPRVFERPVVARTAPPAARAGFAAQQQQLAAKPGQPLDDAARRQLKPAASVPAPVVNVVAKPQTAPPAQRLPPAASGGKPGDARGKADERRAPAAPSIPAAPAKAVPPQATPPAQPAQPPEQRAKPAQPQEQRAKPVQPQEQRGKPEPRERPVAPPQAAPQAAPAKAVPPQAAPPAQPAQPPEQRAKPVQPQEQRAKPVQPQEQRAKPVQPQEQRGKPEPRERPVVPPPQAAPQAAPPAQPAQPLEQRAKPAQPPEQRAKPAQPPEQRAKPAQPQEQRGKPEPRERPVAPPPRAAPQAAPAPPAAAPQASPPQPPSASKGEARGKDAKPDKKKDGEEQKDEEDNRKQKR